jgi:hypothetical protein
MGTNLSSLHPIKVFNWLSTDVAKREYTEFMAYFSQSLGNKGWILSDTGAAVFIPVEPGEELAGRPGDPARLRWREQKDTYDKEMRSVLKNWKNTSQFLFKFTRLSNLIHIIVIVISYTNSE